LLSKVHPRTYLTALLETILGTRKILEILKFDILRVLPITDKYTQIHTNFIIFVARNIIVIIKSSTKEGIIWGYPETPELLLQILVYLQGAAPK
jgi:hypothetical protein